MNQWKATGKLILVIILAVAVTVSCAKKEFTYSDGLDDNGFWKGIKALRYVELGVYRGISIPRSVHEVTAEAIQAEVDTILEDFAESKKIMDRAAMAGDTIFIDFEGSINGVLFEGGSTQGAGTEVTIGVTSYIEGFLEQLIGRFPGESFDIKVTFPENYGNEELNGKEAVFAIILHHIVEKVKPELTDAFVAANLSSNYGFSTVSEMKESIRNRLHRTNLSRFVEDYLVENSTVNSIPRKLLKYQEDSMIRYYEYYANYYNMTLEEFLSTYLNVSSTTELLDRYRTDNTETAGFFLIVQAVAEDAGILVTEDDVQQYFIQHMGIEDYSSYIETYGMPYLKLNVLQQAVLDFIIEHAVKE